MLIQGYAYALVIDGRPIKPWITGKDGALREVNLARTVHQHEAREGGQVGFAHILDQRLRNKVMVRYPASHTFADGQSVSYV